MGALANIDLFRLRPSRRSQSAKQVNDPMNYFEWFGLPVAFLCDEAELRRRFYEKSKALHPDFHTLADEATRRDMLAQASMNNEAYRALSDADRRMSYILNLYGALEEEGQNQVPGEFLMQMMEINEAVTETALDPEAATMAQLDETVKNLAESLYAEILPILKAFDPQSIDQVQLKKVKDYYLKKRYLLRIQENLSKFAHHQENP
jgi:molecular chaperone HscB